MTPPPAGAAVWVAEDPSGHGQLPMDRAIGKLRDEITGVMMDRHRGNSRELALCLTKLDEARLWAEEWQASQGILVKIPRADILRTATTDATDKTGIAANG